MIDLFDGILGHHDLFTLFNSRNTADVNMVSGGINREQARLH
jgi:hypothetical protein